MMLAWAEAVGAGPAVCGGKGYNLGRLARYGFRVPDGGVLTAEAYRLAMRDGGTSLPDPVRAAVRRFLESHGLLDDALAVRSSATAEDSARASFAGIHRSALNVRGVEAIERAILDCYQSLRTPQARAYRERMGFTDGDVECAVVICRMVAAEGSAEPRCAGVAFSADPQSGRRDRIVIDAAPGLGDAVVSGRVTPRRFVIGMDHGRPVVDESGDAAPFQSARQLKELAYAVQRVQWALGEGQDPQDVEWAHDGKALWIVQARPITALPRCGPKDLLRLPQIWSRGNLKDSSPGAPCELAYSGLQEIVFTVAFAGLHAGGYALENGPELVRRFHGRAYFDFAFIQWALFDGFGLPPEETIRAIGGHQAKIEVPEGNPLDGPEGKRRKKAALRLFRALIGFEKKNTATIQEHIARMRRLADEPLDRKSKDELRALVETLYQEQLKMSPLAGLANSAVGRWRTPLEQILKRVIPDRATALLDALCAGSDAVTSAEQGYQIRELARAAQEDSAANEWLRSADGVPWANLPADSAFRRAFQSFLEQFGHRANIETDMWYPRWVEDPSPLFEQIRNQIAGGLGPDVRAAARERRQAAEREIRKRRPLLWPLVRWMARGMRRGFAVRELAKSALVAGVLPSRRITLEVGRRFVAGGLLDDPQQALDLAGVDGRSWFEGFWDGRGARELAKDRRARRETWLREEAPDVIAGDGGAAPADVREHASAEGVWRGTPVASGRAAGAARVVLGPGDGANLVSGDILIAPATDPGWTPLFVRASAVVMESGGYLSHGAIVAREFGLPAVVNVPGILRQVREGEKIRVDGDEGIVTRVG